MVKRSERLFQVQSRLKGLVDFDITLFRLQQVSLTLHDATFASSCDNCHIFRVIRHLALFPADNLPYA